MEIPQEAARQEQQERPLRPGAPSAVATPDLVGAPVVERARAIARRTGHALLAEVTAAGQRVELQPLNNALMDAFREHRSAEAYSLLFELNVRPFALFAAQVMRRLRCRVDANDVLQEAFLAIYRYPSRFRPEKPNAFRNWAYSIIRNTVLRHLQRDGREGVPVEMLADMLPDPRARGPGRVTEEAESDARCQRAWMLVLCLYSRAFEAELKPRDRLALELVEVQKLGYREAAEVLGIRLENFKMVVCRARKKIAQTLLRVLGSQLP